MLTPFVVAALLATNVGDAFPDPAACLTVVDDMGKVGYRIGDAQALAEATVNEFRRRQGNDAVVYEGFLVSSEALKKMLGSQSESQVTDDQIAYYKAAVASAKHRVRVRFGKRKKTHYVVVTCRASSSGPDDVLATKEVTAANFGELREAYVKALPDFCPAIATRAPTTPAQAAPGAANGGAQQTAPPPSSSKKKREWTLPPKR